MKRYFVCHLITVQLADEERAIRHASIAVCGYLPAIVRHASFLQLRLRRLSTSLTSYFTKNSIYNLIEMTRTSFDKSECFKTTFGCCTLHLRKQYRTSNLDGANMIGLQLMFKGNVSKNHRVFVYLVERPYYRGTVSQKKNTVSKQRVRL